MRAETGCTVDDDDSNGEGSNLGSMTMTTVDAALEKSQQLIRELALLTRSAEESQAQSSDMAPTKSGDSECATPGQQFQVMSTTLSSAFGCENIGEKEEEIATEMAELWRRLRGLEDRLGCAGEEVVAQMALEGYNADWAKQAAEFVTSAPRASSVDSTWQPEGSPMTSYRDSAPQSPADAVQPRPPGGIATTGSVAQLGMTPGNASGSMIEGLSSYPPCTQTTSIAENARQAVVRRHSRQPSWTSVNGNSVSGGALPRSSSGTTTPLPFLTPNGYQSVVVTQVHKYLAWVKNPGDAQSVHPAASVGVGGLPK